MFGFLVDLNRGISSATAAYQAGRAPTARMGRQLAGTTIGIIGYGAIGRAVAPIAAAMGMRVLISDPHVTIDDANFCQVDLPTLLAESDHVVCLAIAIEATENLIDAKALSQMRRDAGFHQRLARRILVDEVALAAALKEGASPAPALDVGRAPDQMPTPALAALPNVIATPMSAASPRPQSGAGASHCGAGARAGVRRGAGRRRQHRKLDAADLRWPLNKTTR